MTKLLRFLVLCAVTFVALPLASASAGATTDPRYLMTFARCNAAGTSGCNGSYGF